LKCTIHSSCNESRGSPYHACVNMHYIQISNPLTMSFHQGLNQVNNTLSMYIINQVVVCMTWRYVHELLLMFRAHESTSIQSLLHGCCPQVHKCFTIVDCLKGHSPSQILHGQWYLSCLVAFARVLSLFEV